MNFVAYKLETSDPRHRAGALNELRGRSGIPLLILDTCQRLEVFGIAVPNSLGLPVSSFQEDAAAFERLARIAAGLESRVLGELEILGQVRTAYRNFVQSGGAGHSRLDRIFQDALALAREARRESGIDANLTSLGALAARALMERVASTAPVAVIGAGSLAGSVARYLTKRGDYPVRISSRCPENALSLAMEVGGFAAGLDELAHLLNGVAGIVTATAAPHPVLYTHHLDAAARPLTIIDLGVPRDCNKDVPGQPGITYIPLEDIETKAQLNSQERRQRAEVAARIIRDGALAWSRGR